MMHSYSVGSPSPYVLPEIYLVDETKPSAGAHSADQIVSISGSTDTNNAVASTHATDTSCATDTYANGTIYATDIKHATDTTCAAGTISAAGIINATDTTHTEGTMHVADTTDVMPAADAVDTSDCTVITESALFDDDELESQAGRFGANIVNLLAALDDGDSAASTIESLLASLGFDDFIGELERSFASDDE